jgi:hypothetical protein
MVAAHRGSRILACRPHSQDAQTFRLRWRPARRALVKAARPWPFIHRSRDNELQTESFAVIAHARRRALPRPGNRHCIG